MKTKLLIVIALSIALVGCGDSRIRKIRNEYVSGCQASGLSKSLCKCAFDKFESTYTKEQLLGVEEGRIPADFTNAIMKSMMACKKEE